MANIGTQPVHFFNRDNTNVYNGTIQRDVEQYPLTSAGQAALEAAVVAGTFTITVDNGAVIPPGTLPPLTRPSPM